MRNSNLNYVTLDVESTIKNKGNPFTKSNKLVMVGLKDNEGYHEYQIEHSTNCNGYSDALSDIGRRIRAADLLVGFNIKFDLHWLRRYNVDFTGKSVFDCQLAHFILSNQADAYPSLDGVAFSLDLGVKLNVVESEYWNLGIDTDAIPIEVLADYLRRDVELTEQVFQIQRTLLEGKKRRLFWLQCEDLLILEEMEWNGLLYDIDEAKRRAEATRRELSDITSTLDGLVHQVPVNWGSSDDISCVLYGGAIPVDVRIPTERVLKDGTIKKAEKWGVQYHACPQLVKPPKNSEVKPTEGLSDDALATLNVQRQLDGKRPLIRHYSVSEPVLRRINTSKNKVARAIITNLLSRARLEKLDSTYYTGLLKRFAEHEWDDGIIHGQFNQCVAVTGRLSSSKPNLQNFAGAIKALFRTRFAT